jgi:arginine/lysine/ornithine decarboxylase
MPSEEEINKQAEQAAQRDTKDGRIGIIIDSTYYGVFCDALEWLRSRLTNPESSQKTEGGEG